jgi:hypothetical protein
MSTVTPRITPVIEIAVITERNARLGLRYLSARNKASWSAGRIGRLMEAKNKG